MASGQAADDDDNILSLTECGQFEGTGNGNVFRRDPKTLLFTLRREPIRAIVLSPNGRYLVVGTDMCSVLIWDLLENNQYYHISLKYQISSIKNIVFHLDTHGCQNFSVACSNGIISRCEIGPTGFRYQRFFENGNFINSMCLSPDDDNFLWIGTETLIVGNYFLEKWDLSKDKCIVKIPMDHKISAIIPIELGIAIATGNQVLLFTLEGENFGSNELPPMSNIHTITCMAVSNDDTTIVTGGHFKQVCLWNAYTGQYLECLKCSSINKDIDTIAYNSENQIII
jgi:WD40 repeat protein